MIRSKHISIARQHETHAERDIAVPIYVRLSVQCPYCVQTIVHTRLSL